MSRRIVYTLASPPEESYGVYRSWILGLRGLNRAPAASSSHSMKADENIMLQIAEVTDSLYLCSARAIKASRLRELGVTCVVNATVELPNLPIDKVEYVKVEVEDSPYASLSPYFEPVADKIELVRRSGGKTLVHCVAGVSRSASLCLAYLMKYQGMSLRHAYHHLKARRPVVRPNHGFFRQLLELERRLTGHESVRMLPNAALGMLIPDVYEPDYRNTLHFHQKYISRRQQAGGASGGQQSQNQSQQAPSSATASTLLRPRPCLCGSSN